MVLSEELAIIKSLMNVWISIASHGDDNIIDIVHTDNDNLDNVDYSDLEKLSEVIYKFISENRYDMNEIKTGN